MEVSAALWALWPEKDYDFTWFFTQQAIKHRGQKLGQTVSLNIVRNCVENIPISHNQTVAGELS